MNTVSETEKIEFLYQEGIRLYNKQHYTDAFYCFENAANLDHSPSMIKIGRMYELGEGVALDYQEALYWYRKAAYLGFSGGELCLGVFYEEGKGIKKNISIASKWYQKAASQGSIEAAFKLGCLYYRGAGVPEDKQMALRLFIEGANRDYARAAFMAARIYCSLSKHDPAYRTQALHWYTYAAERNYPRAQYNLGCFYEMGVPPVLQQDDVLAFRWYEKAAKNGHADAQSSLGHCYFNGIGITKDNGLSLFWYTRAIENGATVINNTKIKHKIASYKRRGSQSMLQDEYKDVNQAYLEGTDVRKDKTLVQIGDMFLSGTHVKKNHEKALEWYLKAAERDNPEGQFKLGKMYFEGLGTIKNYNISLGWFKKAYKHGVQDALAYIERAKLSLKTQKTYFQQVEQKPNLKEVILVDDYALRDFSTEVLDSLNEVYRNRIKSSIYALETSDADPIRSARNAFDAISIHNPNDYST
ncbi:Uncharacterized protein YbeQ [Choanephora cucurbitarum]|uniref:Uncharacterized protein YbeQ n=1 Tax=Choanephora cucurbitarum TaxID=101091 RepID=A0A1C7NKI1_9FUNG|nr:Uncharacterized protein YbeQ [Choanephora cucurbitarum]